MASPMLAFAARGDVPAPPGMERLFCAMRVPYLPAPLPPSTGAEQALADLARDMLRGQAHLISGMARWREQAIALRYVFRPESGTVEIAMLLRALAPQGRAATLAYEMSGELARGLAGAGIATAPVSAEAEVLALLMPAGHQYIAEVRQQEDVVQLRAGGAYAVCPLRPMPSAWQSVFEQVIRQQAPCVINVHLQPTHLRPAEQTAFGEAAGLAHALEDFRYSGYSTIEHSDPLAEVVGDLYADSLRRFTSPFLVVVQVASSDHRAVLAITGALVSHLSERMEIREAKASGKLPAGAQVVFPQTPTDAALAQQTLMLLDLQPWGDAATRPEQRRLPYLMDAATAAAAFRFPVAANGRIPGIATRMVMPGSGGRPIGRIFLSYRRGDSAGTTGRIYDRLAARYGKDAIFMDVSSLPAGVDFMEHIRRAIRESAVQLVLIGPGWLDAADSEGKQRLDQPADPVRNEVEAGLGSGRLVVPVLLDGTPMPAPERLPADLQALRALNSCPVRHTDFDHDMERLIAAVDEQMRRHTGVAG